MKSLWWKPPSLNLKKKKKKDNVCKNIVKINKIYRIKVEKVQIYNMKERGKNL